MNEEEAKTHWGLSHRERERERERNREKERENNQPEDGSQLEPKHVVDKIM